MRPDTVSTITLLMWNGNPNKSIAERAGFAVMIAIGLLPVLIPGRFITLDGGAHAYNAHVTYCAIFAPWYRSCPSLFPLTTRNAPSI